MTLGQNIARLRAQKNLSQGDLADALEVSRQSVSKWETDASIPELDKLLRLAELFGVTLDELVKGESAQPEAARGEAPDKENAGAYTAAAPAAAWAPRRLAGTVRAAHRLRLVGKRDLLDPVRLIRHARRLLSMGGDDTFHTSHYRAPAAFGAKGSSRCLTSSRASHSISCDIATI